MTAFLTSLPVGGILLGLCAGLLLGIGHFASLRWNADLLMQGRAARAAILMLGRFALLGLVLFGLALLGALPLLAGALGVILGRMIVLRRGRQMP